MGIPAKKLVQLLIEQDPASPEFRNGVRETLGPQLASSQKYDGTDLWHDVFVQQPLPWGRFLQSALLHTAAFALIWALSMAWLRQQKILTNTPFDRSSLVTYSPDEYLPPIDTGTTEAPKAQVGDPAFAKQPILSVPREADNRSQTIVAPPDVKLDHDVALPNIIATGAIAPAVPLDATRSVSNRAIAPDAQVVGPAPDVNLAHDHVTRGALRSDVIPPPPEIKRDRTRGVDGPQSAVIEPPPELTTSAKGHTSTINIGPSDVVAPAPQLTMAEQHAASGRGKGGGNGRMPGSVEPVGPAPSVAASGGAASQGRLIALGIHPVAPTGPVAVPGGNRGGSFSANPQGKAGASGTPDIKGSASNNGSGVKGRSNGSLPAGLHVGAVPGATSPIERNGGASSGNGSGEGQEQASLSTSGAKSGAGSGQRPASAVSDDKISDVERQVFGDRRAYGTTLNMPNLNSTTGSWVMHFAEMQPGQKQGELLTPMPTETSDPGYPLELIQRNVQGKVTLYAVIHSDGHVGDIRVLNSPDDRLDRYAANALAHWKFLPATRAGKPIAIEAVVVIPFRVRKAF